MMNLRSHTTRVLMATFGLSLLILGGCSSGVSVNFDYDTTTNFSAY